MRSIAEIEDDLKKEITAAVVPLQTTRDVNTHAFMKMVQLASEGARVLKGKQQLPRTFLAELFVTAQIIRREGEYSKNSQVLESAKQLEMVFELILRGETPEDRKPGVPRII